MSRRHHQNWTPAELGCGIRDQRRTRRALRPSRVRYLNRWLNRIVREAARSENFELRG